jgi:SnoaL-like domain
MNTESAVASILERLDRLEARFAMRDLVSDYCHGFDKRQWDRFLAIWWPDCIWNIGPPFGTFEGHTGIEKATKEILWNAWRDTSHWTTNLRVWFDDADHARGECDVDCFGATKDDQPQMISATYRDVFERRDAVWKIKRRDVQMHYFNPIPGAQMTPPKAS